jgi:nitroimidazol reductase NimA-like FMN-containing flavoprotein (pyridoxamine 5'-phosphate oxidase superfamily)
MKQIFEIKDRIIINELLDSTEYGTLAVSYNDEPYAVPVNFVRIDDDIYFHGALSNKKMKILASNPKVSFSVVQNYSLIASFFSSSEGLACPATQFFKSVSIDGVTKLVESREEKAMVFEALMKKLQPEGGYKSFSDAAYDTAIKATAVIKIVPRSLRCKFKFGQHVTKERFDMILSHLEERDTSIDKETVKMMKQLRVENAL